MPRKKRIQWTDAQIAVLVDSRKAGKEWPQVLKNLKRVGKMTSKKAAYQKLLNVQGRTARSAGKAVIVVTKPAPVASNNGGLCWKIATTLHSENILKNSKPEELLAAAEKIAVAVQESRA